MTDAGASMCAGPDGSEIVATSPFADLPGPRATAFADGVFYVYGRDGHGAGKVLSVPASGGALSPVRDIGANNLVDLTAAPGLGWALIHERSGEYELEVSPNILQKLPKPLPDNFYRAATFALGANPRLLFLAREKGTLKVQLGSPPEEVPFAVGGTDIAVDDATIFLTSVLGSQRIARTGAGPVAGDSNAAASATCRAFARHGGKVFFAGIALPAGAATPSPIIAKLEGLSLSEQVVAPPEEVRSFAVADEGVCWTDGKAIYRFRRADGSTAVLRPGGTETIDHLVIDGACLYFWSLQASESVARLRVIAR